MKCRLPRKLNTESRPIPSATVTITGYANSGNYVLIDGTRYSSAQTLEVPLGTEITAYLDTEVSSRIYFNGKSVANASNTTNYKANYTFVLTTNTTINYTREEEYDDEVGTVWLFTCYITTS